MKITAKTLDTVQLQPGQKEIIRYDEDIPGFGLRIRAGGSRVLIYQYRLAKLNRRITLGPAVKEAFPRIRERVMDMVAQVRLGQDPAAAKQAAIQAAQQLSSSFKSIAEMYLAKKIKRINPRTYREEKLILLEKARSLHALPLAAITRREIAVLLNQVETGVTKGKGGAATVNKMRAYLSVVFNWAMREGLCDSNPVVGTNRREEIDRKRVLSIAELVEIWHALPDTNFGKSIKLLVLTGQRRQEIGAVRWNEIDLNKAQIILPSHRSKNKLEHIIPLSQPACDILAGQFRVKGWPTVFSASESGLSGWGIWKEQLDRKLLEARTAAGQAPIEHWALHDLRRSVATHMGEELGVLPHIIEAILNHQSGSKAGVAGIYNRAKYLKEKTAALTLWAEHLMAEVSGKSAKVVPLRMNG